MKKSIYDTFRLAREMTGLLSIGAMTFVGNAHAIQMSRMTAPLAHTGVTRVGNSELTGPSESMNNLKKTLSMTGWKVAVRKSSSDRQKAHISLAMVSLAQSKQLATGAGSSTLLLVSQDHSASPGGDVLRGADGAGDAGGGRNGVCGCGYSRVRVVFSNPSQIVPN